MADVEQATLNGDIPQFSIGAQENCEDTFEPALLQEELRNIQNVIRLTKENLEALNAEFGKHQHPPTMYLQEYEGLTSKIHELQLKEQKLQDQIGSCEDLEIQQEEERLVDERLHQLIHDQNYVEPGGGTIPHNNSSTSLVGLKDDITNSPQMPHRSPMKAYVKAFLPNQQKTTVPVKPGMTVEEALYKAMKRRELSPELCIVYSTEPRAIITWNTDSAVLAGKELTVELKAHFLPTTSISHNFVRKTFFTLAFCDSCRKLLFQGFRCQTCGYRFHQRCAEHVPTLCQQGTEEDVFYMAKGDRHYDEMREKARHAAWNEMSSHYCNVRRPVRSTSAPNVRHSLPPNPDLLEYLERSFERSYEKSPLERSYEHEKSPLERSYERSYEKSPLERSYESSYEKSPLQRSYERSCERSPLERSCEKSPLERSYERSFDKSSLEQHIHERSNERLRPLQRSLEKLSERLANERPHDRLHLQRSWERSYEREQETIPEARSLDSAEWPRQGGCTVPPHAALFPQKEFTRRYAQSHCNNLDLMISNRCNEVKKRHGSDSAPQTRKHHNIYPTIHKGHNIASLMPPMVANIQSPGGSPTKPVSATASPTNSVRYRVRSSSAETEHRRKVLPRRDSNEDWEIPTEEIITSHRIGSGSFGTVYRGHWHGPVAIKRLNVTDPTEAQMQAFKNEVAVLRKTRHVNVLLFMGWTSKPQLAIVTQWCEGSSLYKHLHVLETKFEMIQLIDIARQTAQGMDYLHAKSIIHRDMKSNNIFLHDDLTVKIGDFGLATVKTRWSGSHQFQQTTGSILWMAPEVIRMKEDNPYTFKSDMYAFGIVMYELMTTMLPYCHINNKDQILFMVGKGYLRPDMTLVRKDTPKAFKRLYQDCIKFARDERPLFPQVLASLENLVRSLPKIHRSASEPTLNRTHPQSDDMDLSYVCASPKTPINSQYGAFPFFSSGTAY
ncbi:serine/threonine-protein kinase B-raf-like isoform X2 [Lineus longissimus]|uniref:serine/threonine-protein kinase B-raf-like isoform X2 n=1 Tax=Lineus longissimus TaxID=88925 RepID=UPI00315CE4D1